MSDIRLIQSETPKYMRLTNRAGRQWIVSYHEFLRLRGLKRKPFINAELACIHRCTVCGFEGPWTEDWEWFGSYQDLSDDVPVGKMCSAACKEKHQQQGHPDNG